MNKTELIDEIAKDTKITKKDISATLDAFMDTVKSTLKGGDKITLVGFGTFQPMKRKARNGIVPGTKKKIKIPAKTVAKLKFSKDFLKK